MAGKKKQPPKPPGSAGRPPQPPVTPAPPVAPPQPVAEPTAAAPVRPSAPLPPAAPAPAPRPAAKAEQRAAVQRSHGPARAVSAGPDIPLLGLDWDELPAVRVRRLPYWTLPIAYCLIVFSFILLAMAYVARNTYHTVNRISIIPDMDNEPRWKTQQANYMFADHRASRPWPDGAVPRGLLENDDHYYRGIVGGAWATGLPAQLTIDRALLERGRQRYNIYCTPCHGEAGYGDGMVAQHADMLKEGTWTQPLNYHTDQVRSRPDGHIFNTITNGIRTMPPYGSQIPVADRWAIVAWIRVLQASQGADLSSLPADKQAELLKRKPAVEPTPAQQAGATAGELVQQPDGSLAGAAATQPPAQRETGLPAGPPPSPENVPQGSTK